MSALFLRIVAIAIVAFSGCISVSAAPEIVIESDTGRIVLERDATQPWHPASLTKLMTVYVTLSEIEAGRLTLETPVTITASANSAPPSRMEFKVGSRLTLETALKILMVKSANDIAIAVAETVSGSTEAFVAKMNAASHSLGMSQSHWANPHGLHDPSQVTTARDMAILARRLLSDFPEDKALYGIHGFTINGKTVKNHNGLIGRVDGADGMKTGYICASGFNIVATVTRGDRQLIAVVFGFETAMKRDAHAAHLIEAAFEAPGVPVLVSQMLPGIDMEAPNMRPFICEGRSMPESGDGGPPDVSLDRLTAQFKKIPRRLEEPVQLSLLPAVIVPVMPRPLSERPPEPMPEVIAPEAIDEKVRRF